MVAGQKIDDSAVEAFVADADLVIAHHAAFDRKFVERRWPVFEHRAWACSATEIDWKAFGYSGAKLSYLAVEAGFFYDAHRAGDDCHALLELLAAPLCETGRTTFAVLLDAARRKTYRIWAEYSPYDLKEVLKSRGYRWNNGADGSLKSWYIDVDERRRDVEIKFLREEIYQRDVDIRVVESTAHERFSVRQG
jgi:DNA polymerase III subunit epsilon